MHWEMIGFLYNRTTPFSMEKLLQYVIKTNCFCERDFEACCMSEEKITETANTANLQLGESNQEFPIFDGTIGPSVVDISKLYAQTGRFTYDPGFTSTASCESKITYIDGDEGILLYRGYPIGELAEKSSFLETSYLLLKGELPNKNDYNEFVTSIADEANVPSQLYNFFSGFGEDAHPMAMLCGVVGGLSAYYHEATDINNASHRLEASQRLIAKIPTIAAMAFRHSVGENFVEPEKRLGYAENFLNMCFQKPTDSAPISSTLVRAMERIFILHADHEQNASTSTVRLASSSGANPYACIAAGIACLWGPAHGGANEAALKMLSEIGSVDRIPDYINKAKDKNDPFRLMGFGHRVYKNYDPRATVMQETCHEVLAELGIKDDPLLDVAMELERIALSDEYFVEKKLYPNIDFYSGITLKAMGFPTSMFTVLFALARTVGWAAQWNEMIEDPSQRIGRPRQLYTGYSARDYIEIAER